MKHASNILNIFLVFAVLFLLVIFGLPALPAQAAPPAQATATVQVTQEPVEEELVCETGRSIQVSGTAVVNVLPDRALIQLGLQSNGKTPQRVEASNSATIDKITRALKSLGVEEKDIVTDWYVIHPIYDDGNSLTIEGYRIDNVMAVTLRDISKVNRLVAAALEAGANEIVNVEFYLSDLRKYRDQAREMAMKAAQEKARDLASAAGAQTGCVLSINENSWSSYNGGWLGHSRDLWTQNVMQNAAPAGGESGVLTEAGPVNLGQISVRADVSASFSLK